MGFNDDVIAEFRANDGVVGGPFEGFDLLLLHTTGAKSGLPRIAPLVYLRDGDRYVVIASKGGAPDHPSWYHNAVANPRVTIEVGTAELPGTASVATGADRDRLYALAAERYPFFAEYERKTTRTIPVVTITPDA